MSRSEKSRLRIIPYNIIIVFVFLVAMPILPDPAIILLVEIPEYLTGYPNFGEQFSSEIRVHPSHAVDLTIDHWYEVFESEGYWEQTYGSEFDGAFARIFLTIGMPIMIVMTYLILRNYSISKLKWIGIMTIIIIGIPIVMILVLGIHGFLCPPGVELCKLL